MAYRHQSSSSLAPNSYPSYSNPAEPNPTSLSGAAMPPAPDPASPSLSNKRHPLQDPNVAHHPGAPIAGDDTFITDHDAGESGGDDEDEDDKPKSDKRTGRRKIKIEFIQDKSRRHITFSKRKAGIMKKAYELSTLTGTQVLLLVVSETGLVYTFTTAKLQPLVTQPEGKNLIQACLNAPHGQLPSSMPVGTPIGRSSNPMNMGHHTAATNVPGGLSISGGANKEDGDGEDGEGDDNNAGTAPPTRKRRRGSSSAGAGNANTTARPAAGSSTTPANAQGPTTSPHARTNPIPPLTGPPALTLPSTQSNAGMPLDAHSPRQGAAQPTSPNYTHATPYGQQGDAGMYGTQAHGQTHTGYPGGPPPPPFYGHEGGGPQATGIPHGSPWGTTPTVPQGTHYAPRR